MGHLTEARDAMETVIAHIEQIEPEPKGNMVALLLNHFRNDLKSLQLLAEREVELFN